MSAESSTSPLGPRTDPARWTAPFFAIWTGQAFSLLGSMLVQFALVWWLTRTTGSATVLAGATLVAVLPSIVVGPFAGALVDRWNRRWVMIAADGLIALVTLGLIGLCLADGPEGASFPCGRSEPDAAGRDERHRPAAGRCCSVSFRFTASWRLTYSPLCLAITSLFLVTIPQPQSQTAEAARSGAAAAPAAAAAAAGGLLADVRAGFRYVAGWPGLMAILGMAMALNFIITPPFPAADPRD